MKYKFKIGDIVEPCIKGSGFEGAVVLNIFTETKGVHKGKEMYLLKIPCGTATIPCNIQDNYQLVKQKK